MPNKAQLSVEYMILTGFILLVVIIPSSYLVFKLANDSVYGAMNNQRAIDMGKGLTESAKQIYYLGLYSKKTVSYEVPNNVDRMFILELTDPTLKKYYYFGIIINDSRKEEKYLFLSDVPISSGPDAYVDSTDSNQYIPECIIPGYSCSYHNFIAPVINPGKKMFKVETVYDVVDHTVVNINPLIE